MYSFLGYGAPTNNVQFFKWTVFDVTFFHCVAHLFFIYRALFFTNFCEKENSAYYKTYLCQEQYLLIFETAYCSNLFHVCCFFYFLFFFFHTSHFLRTPSPPLLTPQNLNFGAKNQPKEVWVWTPSTVTPSTMDLDHLKLSRERTHNQNHFIGVKVLIFI